MQKNRERRPIPVIKAGGKRSGFARAVHLRVSEAEYAKLEAYAKLQSAAQKTQMSLSEAVRDLLALALSQQEPKPWEAALKALPFVAWSGAKPILPPLDDAPGDRSLSLAILEDRGDR